MNDYWNRDRAEPTPGVRDYLGAGRARPAPALRFPQVGDRAEGVIAAAEIVEDLEYAPAGAPRRPKLDAHGDPAMILRVRIDTADGPASLYVGGSRRPGSRSVYDAIVIALGEAHLDDLPIGGHLVIERTRDEPSATPGFAPRHTFRCRITPPSVSATRYDPVTPY